MNDIYSIFLGIILIAIGLLFLGSIVVMISSMFMSMFDGKKHGIYQPEDYRAPHNMYAATDMEETIRRNRLDSLAKKNHYAGGDE